MKNKLISGLLLATLTVTGLIQTSCMGKFALLKKVYSWNESATGNKFVNNLLFWILNILPVYGFAVFVDAVILNLIEFWSGSNPLAMNEGERIEQRMTSSDGKTFVAIATKNRMEVQFDEFSKENFAIAYQPETKSWLLETEEKTICMATELANGQIALNQPTGSQLIVNRDFSAKNMTGMIWQMIAKN